jgi:hypothetical protein
LAVDISKLRKDIEYDALSKARKLEEDHHTDNPYAEGGKKFGFNPRTGKPKISNKKTAGKNNNRGNNRGRGRGRNSYWTGNSDFRGGVD